MPTRRIHKESFNFGVGTNSSTTNFDSHDLSHAQALLCELSLSTIATDAGDSLDVKIQDTVDGVNWNTRVRFPLVAGNAAAPRAYRMVVEQAVAIAQAEQSYLDTGSTGGTEIASGSVVNGTFPGVRRISGTVPPGQSNRTNSWRAVYARTDAGTQNANFIGTLTVSPYDTVRF